MPQTLIKFNKLSHFTNDDKHIPPEVKCTGQNIRATGPGFTNKISNRERVTSWLRSVNLWNRSWWCCYRCEHFTEWTEKYFWFCWGHCHTGVRSSKPARDLQTDDSLSTAHTVWLRFFNQLWLSRDPKMSFLYNSQNLAPVIPMTNTAMTEIIVISISCHRNQKLSTTIKVYLVS